MGINSEFIHILMCHKRESTIGKGPTVLEFGAQDVCISSEMVTQILKDYNILVSEDIVSANGLYSALGFSSYQAIDASGEYGAHSFDLNHNLLETHKFDQVFDVVTNLGTSEHCFNQMSFFQNVHNHCDKDGLMIHAVPMAGNANHGLYHYSPRFFAELAAANNYKIIQLCFTVDYKPKLHPYSLAEYQRYDDHDLLFYAVLQKTHQAPFVIPFDGMFSEISQLDSYENTLDAPLTTEFTPYLKTGDWANIQGKKSTIKQFVQRVFSKTVGQIKRCNPAKK